MRGTPARQPLSDQRRPHTQAGLTSLYPSDRKRTAAMLDRLLHRSVVFNIDGDSYRMRTHRARSEALRPKSGK